MASFEVQEVVGRIAGTVERLSVLYDGSKDPTILDSLIYHLDRLYRSVLPLECYRDEVVEALSMTLALLNDLINSEQGDYQHACRHPCSCVSGNRSRGRPRILISQEQLEYLLTIGFSCPKIAVVLGVSLSTIRRRMAECGLSVASLYSCITDNELDLVVSQIQAEFPNCGYRLMYGQLLCRGHRVVQARIRESLRRVDPEGVIIRWNYTAQRRKYNVLSPLSLWHLDGNHKLIRLTYCQCDVVLTYTYM